MAALPFLAASLIFAVQQKWYWAVFGVCFAAYNVGTRLRRVSSCGMTVRVMLTIPWGVLALMELIAGRWLGVLVYSGILAWHIADKGMKQQRVT